MNTNLNKCFSFYCIVKWHQFSKYLFFDRALYYFQCKTSLHASCMIMALYLQQTIGISLLCNALHCEFSMKFDKIEFIFIVALYKHWLIVFHELLLSVHCELFIRMWTWIVHALANLDFIINFAMFIRPFANV